MNKGVLCGCRRSDRRGLFILSPGKSQVFSSDHVRVTFVGDAVRSGWMPGICFLGAIMVEVPLTRGKVALIDDEDAERVLAVSWQCHVTPSGAYYATSRRGPLHRFILNAPKGVTVDHEDQDGLNCRRNNLRLATYSQNQHNTRVRAANRSGFKGVNYSRIRITSPYRARIRLKGGNISLGCFRTAEEAARAYDAKARELFGEFARLNFPEAHEQPARVSKERI